MDMGLIDKLLPYLTNLGTSFTNLGKLLTQMLLFFQRNLQFRFTLATQSANCIELNRCIMQGSPTFLLLLE